MPTRSRMPIKPWPTPGSAGGPRPSSTTSIVRRSGAYSSSTLALAGPACLSVFVSDSWITRYAARSAPAGSSRAAPERTTSTGSPAERTVSSSGSSCASPGIGAVDPAWPSSVSTPIKRRISASPARPVSSTWAIASCAAFGSRSMTVLAAPAWTIITLIAWATTSCSSRAMRVRSRVTASRAAVSRSSTKRRRRLKTIRPTRMGRPTANVSPTTTSIQLWCFCAASCDASAPTTASGMPNVATRRQGSCAATV